MAICKEVIDNTWVIAAEVINFERGYRTIDHFSNMAEDKVCWFV